MEFVSDYASLIELKANKVREINQIRIYKQVIIPGELVGMNSRQITLYYQDISEKSQIRQKIKYPSLNKPRGKNMLGRWKEFLNWL